MAHSVESRAPFLRHSLIRFALGLPEDAKLRGKTGKRALQAGRARAAAAGDPRRGASRASRRRSRSGRAGRCAGWSRRGSRRSGSARAGVLDVEAARRVLEDHVAGRTERGRTLWTLLSLQMWAERWVTGGGPRG